MSEDPRALNPIGWAPKPGGHVRITADPKAAPDMPPPPAGVWVVVDRAPEARMWWVMARDDDAEAWAAANRVVVVSGCVAVASRWLTAASTAVRTSPK